MMKTDRFVSFSESLSRKVTSQTAFILSVALVCVAVVGIAEVYRLAYADLDKSSRASCLKIENALQDVEEASGILEYAVLDDNVDLLSITRKILQLDTNLMSCAIAYEPYFYKPNRKYYMAISYKNSSGEVDDAVFSENALNYFNEPWYTVPRDGGKPWWSEPSYNIAESCKVATYSVPLYDAGGSFLGVLRLAVSLDWIDKVVNEDKPYRSSVNIVLSASGVAMTHPDSSMLMKTFDVPRTREHGIYWLNGSLKHLQTEPIRSGWTLVATCSYDEFLSPIFHILIVMVLLALAGLFVQYISLRRGISRHLRPLSVMTYSVRNMSRGNFNASIPQVQSNDEVKLLQSSIHLLQKTIVKYISDLKLSTIKQQRIESELDVANRIQLSFLPKEFPVCPEFECYASMKPAKSVGGDLYDFKRIGNSLFFAIGDVSGKGVPAALFMAMSKSAFGFVKSGHTDQIASLINNSFAESNEGGMFITLFVAKVNLETLQMEFCNGGHNPIIIVEPDGSARYLRAKPNIALGLFPDFNFESEALPLSKGCRIIAYTDGISEAENKSKELFGEERLLSYTSSLNPSMTSQEVTEGLLEKVREFTDGAEQNDDMTVFTVKF